MYFSCFLPGCCTYQNRNKMFTMFQEGRQHLRPCVSMEIYSCISVQLRSAEFIFDLHLSIQDGVSANKATRTPRFRRGFWKTNKSAWAGVHSFDEFLRIIFVFIVIATGGCWCMVTACVIRSQGHSHSVLYYFLLSS